MDNLINLFLIVVFVLLLCYINICIKSKGELLCRTKLIMKLK